MVRDDRAMDAESITQYYRALREFLLNPSL
jgi:hypothetical protein